MKTIQSSIAEIIEDGLQRLILSNPENTQVLHKKIVLLLKVAKGEAFFQAEKHTNTQVFHENIPIAQVEERICAWLQEEYRQLDAWTASSVYSFKRSKKGKLLTSKTANPQSSAVVPQPHNKEKNYIIKEGVFVEPLVDLGVLTKEGKVIHAKYDKYKQINRFLELVEDAVQGSDKPLTILDFGCGKSYLTFILYYYFTEVRQMEVQMVGLDLKADVIQSCNAIAQKYGYYNLHFELGDVSSYQCSTPVDMVITLHACDTATDYALYNAVRWQAKWIFSVPCCQHELNGQIQTDTLAALTRYGIVKERVSALITDALRANLLEYAGYKTQLLEFIDIAHSPKNILIRATRHNNSPQKRTEALAEVKNLMDAFHLHPTLYHLLMEENTRTQAE